MRKSLVFTFLMQARLHSTLEDAGKMSPMHVSQNAGVKH